MALRYADHLKNCKKHKPSCPPDEFGPTTRVAFRFMRKPANEREFDPPPVKNGGIKKGDTCTRLALSFFESLPGARKKFKELDARVDARDRYGTHIGEIKLKTSDGLAGPPGYLTHFDLHQAVAAEFHNRVTAYHDLPAEDDDDDAA